MIQSTLITFILIIKDAITKDLITKENLMEGLTFQNDEKKYLH